LAAIEKQVGGTAEATANDSDKMKVAFSQLAEKIGLALLPALSAVTAIALKFSDWATENSKIFIIVGGVIGGVAATILVLNAAMKAYAAIQKIVNVVTLIWNALLTANPIGLVILAIAAFIAIMAALYFKFDSVRKIVDTVFQGLMIGGKAVFDALKFYFTTYFDIYKALFNGIAKLWNNTIGKLSFEFPSWVPGLGGKGFSVPNIPMLANGGIVTGPTLALLGEKGPEMVIPLNRARGAGGGTYNITINGGLASSAEIGGAVINAIKAFNRTNGPAQIQVAA